MKTASADDGRHVNVTLTASVGEYVKAMKIARHETERFAKAIKYARKQQRKLLDEGDI